MIINRYVLKLFDLSIHRFGYFFAGTCMDILFFLFFPMSTMILAELTFNTRWRLVLALNKLLEYEAAA